MTIFDIVMASGVTVRTNRERIAFNSPSRVSEECLIFSVPHHHMDIDGAQRGDRGRERGLAWPPGVVILMSLTNQWHEGHGRVSASVIPPGLNSLNSVGVAGPPFRAKV